MTSRSIRRAAAALLLAAGGCVPRPAERPVPEPAPPPQVLPEGRTAVTLVWVLSPARNLPEWLESAKKILHSSDEMRFVAVLPAPLLRQLDPASQTQLLELIETGRLEIAAAPISLLPLNLLKEFRQSLEEDWGLSRANLLASPRKILKPIDLERMVILTEELWLKQFPDRPLPGFTAALGIWPAREGLAGGNFSWILTGATAPLSGWTDSPQKPRFAALAFENFKSLESLAGIVVIDEIFNKTPEDALKTVENVAALVQEDEAAWQLVDLEAWKTLSMVPISNQSQNSPPNSWAAEPKAALYWGSPAQKNYWFLMARLRGDIMQYQNSGKAVIASLDRLWEDYFSLLNHEILFALTHGRENTEESLSMEQLFLTRVTAMYKTLAVIVRKPNLPASLWKESMIGDVNSSVDATATSLHFLDSPQPPALTPEGDLGSLRILWSEQEFILEIEMLSEIAAPPSFELYLDLNNQPYQGRGKSADSLLRTAPSDFWEYLLKGQENGSLTIERINPGGGMVAAPALPNAIVQQGSLSKVRFPRSLIAARNPRRWGWALCILSGEGSRQDCLNGPFPEEGVLPFMKE